MNSEKLTTRVKGGVLCLNAILFLFILISFKEYKSKWEVSGENERIHKDA